jgi:hypothetical protein
VVIIDTAPDDAARAAIEACDVVLVPHPSAHNLRAIKDTIELCRARAKTLRHLSSVNNVTAHAEAVNVLEQNIDVLPVTIGVRRVQAPKRMAAASSNTTRAARPPRKSGAVQDTAAPTQNPAPRPGTRPQPARPRR